MKKQTIHNIAVTIIKKNSLPTNRIKSLFLHHIIFSLNFITVHLLRYYFFLLTEKILYYPSCHTLSRSIQGQYNCPTQFIFGVDVCMKKKKTFPHLFFVNVICYWEGEIYFFLVKDERKDKPKWNEIEHTAEIEEKNSGDRMNPWEGWE